MGGDGHTKIFITDVTSLKVSDGLTRETGSSSLHQHMGRIPFPVCRTTFEKRRRLEQNKDDCIK